MTPLDAPAKGGQWHIRKELHIGHVLATVTLAVSAVVYVQQQDTKIEVMRQALVSQDARISAIEARGEQTAAEIKAGLIRLEDKLDRVLLQDRQRVAR